MIPSRSSAAIRALRATIPASERLRTLQRAIGQSGVDEANPYQHSFTLFLRDCVWTIDEARAGEVRQWPRGERWDDIWTDWEEALLCCSPLLIDKTRRVMASNVCCAFDLWIASGGRDPRWPELMLSSKNRRVLIQAQKLEGPGGSAEFVQRVRALYEEAERRGLRERWPTFPDWQWRAEAGHASNGGRIDAVPQGADQVRGPGTTLLHAEELSFWEQAQATMETAIASLHPAGHVVAVTTPCVTTYAADIRRGEIKH